ncbi:MAG: hypothetical protein DRN19_06390, partial [Thermoplasmata archaeon]
EASQPLENLQQIDIGAILNTVPPQTFSNMYILIFLVLIVHSLILALTIRTLRGSHIMITPLYFVPMVWISSLTGFVVKTVIGSYI